jgi:hypothetical protein
MRTPPPPVTKEYFASPSKADMQQVIKLLSMLFTFDMLIILVNLVGT